MAWRTRSAVPEVVIVDSLFGVCRAGGLCIGEVAALCTVASPMGYLSEASCG